MILFIKLSAAQVRLALHGSGRVRNFSWPDGAPRGCNPLLIGFAGDYLAGWARGSKSPASGKRFPTRF